MKLIGKHPNMSVNNINNEKLKDHQNDVNEGNGDKAISYERALIAIMCFQVHSSIALWIYVIANGNEYL